MGLLETANPKQLNSSDVATSAAEQPNAPIQLGSLPGGLRESIADNQPMKDEKNATASAQAEKIVANCPNSAARETLNNFRKFFREANTGDTEAAESSFVQAVYKHLVNDQTESSLPL